MRLTRPLHVAGLLVLAGASTPANWAQLIFGADVSGDTLVSVNSGTLSGVTVGPLGVELHGLAFDAGGGVLYGIGAGTDTIYVVNVITGVATALTTLPALNNANGLAFDAGNRLLYITDNGTNRLYSYHVDTELFTVIGTIGGGFSGVEGLGYDAGTGKLFGLAANQAQIIVITTANAAATGLPNGLVAGIWRGLDFDSGSGKLLATRMGAGGILTSIDPLTGIGTDLGAISGGGTFTFLQGLAVQPIAVPEPTVTGLTAFGLALCGLARRRPRKV